jgi:hypothetical protein
LAKQLCNGNSNDTTATKTTATSLLKNLGSSFSYNPGRSKRSRLDGTFLKSLGAFSITDMAALAKVILILNKDIIGIDWQIRRWYFE